MKKIVYGFVALVVVVAVGFLAMHFFMSPPDDLDLARAKTTEGGLYRVEIAPEVEPIQRGPLHSWVLTLTTPDGEPVEGATIGIDGGMPQHGHGLPTSPAATAYLGEGRYRIEGVRFNMGGWWVLEFSVSAAPGDDTATFNLTL